MYRNQTFSRSYLHPRSKTTHIRIGSISILLLIEQVIETERPSPLACIVLNSHIRQPSALAFVCGEFIVIMLTVQIQIQVLIADAEREALLHLPKGRKGGADACLASGKRSLIGSGEPGRGCPTDFRLQAQPTGFVGLNDTLSGLLGTSMGSCLVHQFLGAECADFLSKKSLTE